jgi:heme/copper-type cytochrome/quinol oxidase subunit 2
VPVIRTILARTTRVLPRTPLLAISAALALLFSASRAFAADVSPGWGAWWLPPDRSMHGHSIDSLFVVTFWITMITFVAVELCLLVFLIKYRHRTTKKKAHFTHGNTRLEMCWTLAPALILAGLAVANKGAWDALRFNPDADNPNRATILVIGQQFKWNVVYPGPDGKLGKYLIFPKPTDAAWPAEYDKAKKAPKPVSFAGVPGPASLPYDKAIVAINSYIDQVNPLGKVFDDPDGVDDDWSKTPGREIVIPAHRPTEVQLSSKDVIHDFFLPNFRVKLDAVPGMRGKLVFTATMTSKDREQASRRSYTIEELTPIFDRPVPPEMNVAITKDSPGATKDPRREQYLYAEDPKAAKPKTIIRDGGALTKENLVKLKAAGVTQVTAFEPGYWDLVCEELCGQGHYSMQGKIIVLDSLEYNKQFEGGRPLPGVSPSTQPTGVALAK